MRSNDDMAQTICKLNIKTQQGDKHGYTWRT